MSLARSTPTTALGKRKRPTVSYAEKDVLDFLSDGEEDTTVQLDQSSDDESDKDDRTYSTRKVSLQDLVRQSIQSNTPEESTKEEELVEEEKD